MGQDRLPVVVFTGGDVRPARTAALVPPSAVVVAADSGVDHALAAGVMPHVVVGDFDSVSVDGMATVVAAGAEVHRHNPAKDHTDLELALQVAVGLAPTEVVVIGGAGGRLDHVLANAAVLAGPLLGDVPVVAYFGSAAVRVVRAGDCGVLRGTLGQLVTLLPVGGPATAVVTTGLRFALAGDDLHPWSARGVSNEFVDARATVELATGVLLAVVPHAAIPQEER
jgi:thiamine pyrophosphokinase